MDLRRKLFWVSVLDFDEGTLFPGSAWERPAVEALPQQKHQV